jgi:spore coat protein U-like protein
MLRLVLTISTFILLVPGWAWAQVSSCSFSITSINFGNVDTLSGAAVDTTGTLDITCTGLPLTNVRICPNINTGTGGATSGIRHLRGPANAALDFNLFQDSARSVPWGSAQQPALGNPPPIDVTIGALGSVSTSRTIFARAFGSQQGAPTGLYTSTFSGGQVRFNYAAYAINPPACSGLTSNPTRPSFTVQANVAPDCLVTAQNINFGRHGVRDENVDENGGVDVTCTPGTTYNVGLNNGLNGDGPTERRMTLGGQTVTYGLYRDAARSQPWGNTIGSDTVPGTGAGTAQNITVFGRVPPQTTPPPGTYTDTVVVTVT